jgi:WD40 repeat protein
MKNFRIPYWVWIVIAVLLLSTLGTCGLLDRLLGISGCVQNISSGSIEDTKRLLISQDGQILVVRSGKTDTVDILSVLDGSLINTINFNSSSAMGAISISPDGTLLAIQKICDSLQITNTSTKKIVSEQPSKYEDCDSFKAGKSLSGGVVFLPDGKHVAYIVTTRKLLISPSLIDLIVTNISTGEDKLRLTDHITDRSMEEIVLSQNGKWIALRYKDRYELRALVDFALVETTARNDEDAKWFEISPDGQLIKSRVFSSIYSQDGSLKAKSAFCNTEIFSTKTGEIILTLSQPRISLGDHLERISNYFGEQYCSSESIVFTADNKYVYYSYRNHILKWQLPKK